VVQAEAARVDLPDVEARHAVDDPLRDELPHPARARETVCAEAGGYPEAAHIARPEDELAVRRERLGPVDETYHLHLLERRHPHERVRHQLLEARPVLLHQPPLEVSGGAVEPPPPRPAPVPPPPPPARHAPAATA